MRKRLSTAGIVGFLLVSINTQVASAQSDPRKLELGAQFVLLRQRAFSLDCCSSKWDPGFGGRITYDANRILSLEAELNFFPKDSSGRNGQGLFGIKAGRRSDKLGVFGKARPGFMRFSRVFDCPGADKRSCDEFAYAEFAMDLGGVIEYYHSPRSVLRFDVGDTVIHFRDRTEFPYDFQIPRRIEGGTEHSLQISIGVGIRF